MSALNVVAEGEEGIGTKGNAGQLIQPCAFFFSRKNGRLLCENLLPGAVRADIHIFLTDVNIDGVVSLCPLDILAEGQVQNLRALTKEPVVCFLTCQTGTVYTGLLACAHADGLSVFYEADGVGLGVFEDDQRDLHISFCFLGKLFILSHDVGDQRIVDGQLLTALFKGYAVHLLVLDRSRYISRIDLNHVVVSFFLLMKDLQSLLGIARSDDPVGNLSFDQKSGIFIAGIGKGDEISEGRHTVCASGSRIGTGQRGEVFPVHIVYPVDLCLGLGKRKTNSSTCGRYMLKGGSCRKAGLFFQTAYQLPAVESIQEIDITRFAGKHLDRKLTSVFHINAGRFLVGVASIF